MHILDSYALNCGVKVDKPYIYQQYYPLGQDKYITLQPFSRNDGKRYLYWNDVIEYILPFLKERNIKIVQIGVKEDPPLVQSIWTQGSTTINQVAFLVQRSLLHVGVDSFAMHIASGQGKKSLSLHSTNWGENSRPYWSSKEDGVVLEPDRSELKPSFEVRDPGKQVINKIKPEAVAQKILDLLGIKETIGHETVFIGENYTATNIHLIPSSVAPSHDQINFLVVRMDLAFDEDVLYNQLQKTRCSILTDKPIDVKIIDALKENIHDVVYFVDENHDIDFVKFLHGSGINYILVSRLKKEELDKIKFDYLDYNFIFEKKSHKEQRAKVLSDNLTGDLYYKCNKKFLKDGECYSSVVNLKNQIADENIGHRPFHKIKDAADFWEDLEDFYIVKKLD